MEGGFTSELKMQDLEYGVLPNDKLHSRDYNSQRDGFTTVFYCSDCEYQRTLSKGHQKTILNSRSNGSRYSLWTKTFTQIGKLSKMTFNVPHFAARFLNYILYFIAVLSRLLSCWKYSYKRNFLQYVLIFYGVILLSTHSFGEELTFMSQGQGKLLDSFVPVGLGFVYKIPNRTFDCDIERLEVSEGSSRNLPQWLAFDETKQQFAGVPSMKDIGSYEILVVALAKSGSETGKICGMKAFTIYVSSEDKNPSFAGPVLESVSVGLGSSETSPSKSNEHFVCVPGLQAVLATVVISTDIHELGGQKRMAILQGMAQHMNLSFNRVAFFHHDNVHPLISQLENPSIIVSGSGDGRYKKGPKSLLTWKISCGALRLGPTYLTELETSAQDGTISNVLGYPVVGWHVTSGVQKARHRARRAVAGTPTPTATAILPTQFKNVSTVTITSSISLTTAFVTPNSTLMPSLSLSSTLQVTPTLSVSMSSTLAVEPTRNFTSSMPITSPTLDTVVITSTPVLSSLNSTTIFESVTSSPTVNVSSKVNSTFISSTMNSTSTSVILSTVFKNTSSVVSSSVTSANATSTSLLPVLNSTSVLELEKSTVFQFNSSSIMTSTVYLITPSPSVLLPENSSAILNSTISTMLPGTNFSTASLNLTQTASVFTSSVPSSLPVNSSAVTSVLPPSTSVMSSSVALNSTVFMNQTSTIQPSFQTSSFYPPSPTTTSSLTLNVTNMTSSAVSLMVSNTSVVVLSSSSNTTDEVLKTSVVNSSSVVSVVPTLSTVPIITSVNMSTTALLSTVMNTSVVDGVRTSSPVFSTSVLPSSTNVTMTTVLPSSVVLETQTPYPTVTPSNTSTVPLSSSLPPFLNTSSLVVSSSSVVMETESTVVIETRTPYPTVTPSNASTVPLSSSLPPFLNTSTLVVSSSSVVMETASTVVVETRTPYTTVTPSNTSTVPLSSSPTPVLSTSLPVVTSSVSVSPEFSSSTNYTSDILNVTMTTSLVDETPSSNASSQVLTTATVNSSSPIVLPSSVSPTSTALLTTSLSIKVIPTRSITINTTVITNTSVYLELSTLTSVPSVNVTTQVVTPTTFISPSSSSLLEKTTTVLIRNSTTPYFTTTTLSVSSLQPLTSTSVLASSTQVATTALQTSRVMNSSAIFSMSVISSTMSSSFIPSSATSLPVSTSLVMSGISTVLAPSSSWMENSTVATPFTSGSPQTSSSSISSIVVSSIEVSTVLPTSQILSSSVQPLPTNVTPNNPPQLYNEIGRLTATAGKVFRYQISEDVFHDEDGYTRKLTLTLKRFNEEFIAEELRNDSWLAFSADKQEMYGLPMEKDVPSDPERGVKFLLEATDSAGLIGYDAFEILIRISSISYTQSLSMRLDNDFNAFEHNISQRLDLISRISGYYGDSDTSQVRVLSYSQGSILFSWTNDSLPSDVCNTTQFNYVAERVVGSDGVNLAFKEHLFPEYDVINANRTLSGVCNATTLAPPVVPDKVVGTEPSGLWEKHVLPGIIVAIILIIIAVLLLLLFLRRRRANPADPEKRTYKKRKPIILEPEMEMKPRSGKPLILENDELSHPPSYMSEMSLDNTLYYDSDDYDQEDYKPSAPRSSPVYETPPPEYNVPQEPLEQPPPAYRLPPTFYSYPLPPWETSSDV